MAQGVITSPLRERNEKMGVIFFLLSSSEFSVLSRFSFSCVDIFCWKIFIRQIKSAGCDVPVQSTAACVLSFLSCRVGFVSVVLIDSVPVSFYFVLRFVIIILLFVVIILVILPSDRGLFQ